MSSTLEDRTILDPITGLKPDPEFSEPIIKGIYLGSFTIGMLTRLYEESLGPLCELFLMGVVPMMGAFTISQLYKNEEEKHGYAGYKKTVAYSAALEAAGYLLIDLAIR